jgi:hypothetical protein
MGHARHENLPPHGPPRSRDGGARRHHDEAIRARLNERSSPGHLADEALRPRVLGRGARDDVTCFARICSRYSRSLSNWLPPRISRSCPPRRGPRVTRSNSKKTLPDKRGRQHPWVTGGDIEDHARNEILPEVIAFANAQGGSLILGIEETSDKPPRACRRGTATGRGTRAPL